ncbi:MAG: polyprenyl synthetase family protein [Pyrinomonadaceae bacterium]|nr:polyprenyl synthetase family protein [Pyrinomonadaceae bacterium]
MDNVKTFLRECGQVVDKELDRLLPSVEIEPRILHEAVRYSIFAGGKRFRPALTVATGETFGATREKLIKTATAFEMIHTYSLVHDDLPAMDDDDLRRGVPTCHKKFDEATAILTGDVLQTLAFQTISEDKNLSAETRIKLISELSRASGTPTGMVAGQILDLQAEKRDVSTQDLDKIHHAKTGALIISAARCGAIIAETDEDDLRCVTEYAENLGLLFQIVDDLLDVTATAEDLGKTPGKDAIAEKATYPKLYGFAEAQNLAAQTHQNCLTALSQINRQTVILQELAGYILNRKH